MGGSPGAAIGVDVGGTRIRVARIAPDGGILDRQIEPVRKDRDGFAGQLLRLVSAARGDGCPGVGIGIPGRVDADRGVIRSAGNLDIAGLDLPGLIARETGLAARVENDAAMALIAEAALRGGAASGIVAMVTVGTGIGGAIADCGAPWYGAGAAGQFGHIVVAEDGPLCKCGRRGCVETFSSGPALRRLIDEAGLPGDTQAADLLSRADAGDERAAAVLDRWSRPFRSALETLVAVVDPRVLIVGGGLGADMARAIARLPQPDGWFLLPVEPARLGDDAGVIGAGLAAHRLAQP